MDKVVNQVFFKGTVKLLQLTKDMTTEDRDEILKYISKLEASQLTFARKINQFYNDLTINVKEASACYFCHGQNCERCT